MGNGTNISVIIPTYNCGKYLVGAIESALNQTYLGVEIIVVNDGSSDNTDEIVKPYLNRITYLKQDNSGLSNARNNGFLVSRGDFVCFLDADDILLPDKFEKQMAVFIQHPEVGVVICGYYDVEEDGETIIQAVNKHWHMDGLERLLNHEVFPPHAALIRRQALEASYLFPEKIDTNESQEDWQLWLDLALNDVIFDSVAEPLCKYRRRKGSISSNHLKHQEGARRVVKWLRDHPKAGLYKKQIDRLGALVEMEYCARALLIGDIPLAKQTVISAIHENPAFWYQAENYMRLFERSLTIQQVAEWKIKPDPTWFQNRVIGDALPLFEHALPYRQVRRLYAATYLCLSDLAYHCGMTELRQLAVFHALQNSLYVCFNLGNFSKFVRGLIGPGLVSNIRKFIYIRN